MSNKTKKTKSTKKKNTKKTKKAKNNIPTLSKEAYRSLYFVISILIVILSVLQMGIIGRFFDSFFKYLFGSFSYIFYLIIIAIPIYYILDKKLKSPILVASVFILIDFLFQLVLIGNKDTNYISFSDIYNNKVSLYGGGIISYYPVKLLIYLLSYYGSLLIVISASLLA